MTPGVWAGCCGSLATKCWLEERRAVDVCQLVLVVEVYRSVDRS